MMYDVLLQQRYKIKIKKGTVVLTFTARKP